VGGKPDWFSVASLKACLTVDQDWEALGSVRRWRAAFSPSFCILTRSLGSKDQGYSPLAAQAQGQIQLGAEPVAQMLGPHPKPLGVNRGLQNQLHLVIWPCVWHHVNLAQGGAAISLAKPSLFVVVVPNPCVLLHQGLKC
jgi:hypothetical protein